MSSILPADLHLDIRKLLDWRLPKFIVRQGANASTKSPVKTPHNSTKRKVSKHYDVPPTAESVASSPPYSATEDATMHSTQWTEQATKRHTTRRTTIFDRHLRRDLRVEIL